MRPHTTMGVENVVEQAFERNLLTIIRVHDTLNREVLLSSYDIAREWVNAAR
jgi:hypothetical protein